MLSIEGRLINIEGETLGRVEIGDNGLISKVSSPTGKADRVFNDELIFPGFVDIHVHSRECQDHSQDYKEDFVSSGQAAINGGVTAFADMPNNPVPPIDDESYSQKFDLAKKSEVLVLLYVGIGPKTKPLIKRKVPYKVYMSKSVGDLFFESFEDLEKVLSKYEGQSVSFHCEDPKILQNSSGEKSHELRRPSLAELTAVDFALKMIEKYQLIGKVCHISTVEALQKIIQAKKGGLNVSVEISPHHLFFDQSNITSANHFLCR
jgi:dihydroorotase